MEDTCDLPRVKFICIQGSFLCYVYECFASLYVYHVDACSPGRLEEAVRLKLAFQTWELSYGLWDPRLRAIALPPAPSGMFTSPFITVLVLGVSTEVMLSLAFYSLSAHSKKREETHFNNYCLTKRINAMHSFWW